MHSNISETYPNELYGQFIPLFSFIYVISSILWPLHSLFPIFWVDKAHLEY